MNFVSTVTSKGQILIPAPIRKSLGIKSSDRVVFTVTKDSFSARKAPDVEAMYGCVQTKKKLTDNELEQHIQKATEEGMTGDI